MMIPTLSLVVRFVATQQKFLMWSPEEIFQEYRFVAAKKEHLVSSEWSLCSTYGRYLTCVFLLPLPCWSSTETCHGLKIFIYFSYFFIYRVQRETQNWRSSQQCWKQIFEPFFAAFLLEPVSGSEKNFNTFFESAHKKAFGHTHKKYRHAKLHFLVSRLDESSHLYYDRCMHNGWVIRTTLYDAEILRQQNTKKNIRNRIKSFAA